jgi:hypothetical protein
MLIPGPTVAMSQPRAITDGQKHSEHIQQKTQAWKTRFRGRLSSMGPICQRTKGISHIASPPLKNRLILALAPPASLTWIKL